MTVTVVPCPPFLPSSAYNGNTENLLKLSFPNSRNFVDFSEIIFMWKKCVIQSPQTGWVKIIPKMQGRTLHIMGALSYTVPYISSSHNIAFRSFRKVACIFK